MPNIIYDAGALIAAERGRRAFLAMHRESLAAEIDPIVPDVVLAPVVTDDQADLRHLADALGAPLVLRAP